MPNSLAYLVLALWPAFSLWLFTRLPIERALIWTIVGGYMALPPVAAFDLPVMPTLDKFAVANLSALAGCMMHMRTSPLALPRSLLLRLLLAAFIVSPLATTAMNGDPLFIGRGALPGLRLYDAIGIIVGQILFLLPFFMARAVLASGEAHRDLLRIFMVAGLIYSFPMLVEIRLSPQINVWVYGFFQHSFAQMMRQGGFRPIVFMPHGLWVAFFAMSAVVAAAALWRDTGPDRGRLLPALIYLFVILVLCKSLAALLYAMALVPLVLFAPRRMMLWGAFFFAAVSISYPMLRGSGLVPVEALTEWAYGLSEDRGGSLQFRFDNEEMLLAKANERPIFGWGTWGRNLIYNLETGRNISVTDGRWIIVIGQFGWLGYLAEFGLLTIPIFTLAFRNSSHPVPLVVCGTAVILGINLIDMLPNATLVPITWMMAGAIAGYCERVPAETASEGALAPAGVRGPRPLQTIL